MLIVQIRLLSLLGVWFCCLLLFVVVICFFIKISKLFLKPSFFFLSYVISDVSISLACSQLVISQISLDAWNKLQTKRAVPVTSADWLSVTVVLQFCLNIHFLFVLSKRSADIQTLGSSRSCLSMSSFLVMHLVFQIFYYRKIFKCLMPKIMFYSAFPPSLSACLLFVLVCNLFPMWLSHSSSNIFLRNVLGFPAVLP